MSHTILVPFELPDPEPISPALVADLALLDVVALGHFQVPEQTPREMAREQLESDAQAALEEVIAPFREQGQSVRTRLVFGKSRNEAIDRVATEEGCDIILTPGRVETIERLFVPLRGEENFDRILSFVGELLTATDASVTLFHAREESDRLPGEEILADATDRLVEAGIDPDRISQQLSEDDDAGQGIVERAEAFDIVVLGETEPSLIDRILGSVPAYVTADTDDPAFVVRDPQ